ncbi:hypothetical protein Tco_0377693 [Tanacetum coccineum]
MRLTQGNLSEAEKEKLSTFANWLLNVGDGTVGVPDESDPKSTSWIEIHAKFQILDDGNGCDQSKGDEHTSWAYYQIDTKNNGEGLKKCILNGPYVPTSVLIQAVPEAEGRPAVQQHTAIETVLNIDIQRTKNLSVLKMKQFFFAFLTVLEMKSIKTVNAYACNTTNEMWIAIERLQQGESLNVQDVKTNLSGNIAEVLLLEWKNPWSPYTPRFLQIDEEFDKNHFKISLMQENDQFSSTNFNQNGQEGGLMIFVLREMPKVQIISTLALLNQN